MTKEDANRWKWLAHELHHLVDDLPYLAAFSFSKKERLDEIQAIVDELRKEQDKDYIRELK